MLIRKTGSISVCSRVSVCLKNFELLYSSFTATLIGSTDRIKISPSISLNFVSGCGSNVSEVREDQHQKFDLVPEHGAPGTPSNHTHVIQNGRR